MRYQIKYAMKLFLKDFTILLSQGSKDTITMTS